MEDFARHERGQMTPERWDALAAMRCRYDRTEKAMLATMRAGREVVEDLLAAHAAALGVDVDVVRAVMKRLEQAKLCHRDYSEGRVWWCAGRATIEEESLDLAAAREDRKAGRKPKPKAKPDPHAGQLSIFDIEGV